MGSIVVLLLAMVIIFVLPSWLLTQIPFNGYQNSGQVGDTIGGFSGPIVAFIASILTFWAFWVQYEANQQQKNDLARERFENKFFEMLRLHKENINEMNIEGYNIATTVSRMHEPGSGFVLQETEQQIEKRILGRPIFEHLYYELLACHKICEKTLSSDNIPDKKRYLIEISYKFLYFGTEDDLLLFVNKNLERDSIYIKSCRLALQKYRLKHTSVLGASSYYSLPESTIAVKIPIRYPPFIGHFNQIGHYYRHLYMMSKFVSCHSDRIISLLEKKDYMRMVRSQLSTFEQLMLYFNYLSGLGANWENNRNYFFSEFCLIKNLPISLTKFTISPIDEFEELIKKCDQSNRKMFKNH